MLTAREIRRNAYEGTGAHGWLLYEGFDYSQWRQIADDQEARGDKLEARESRLIAKVLENASAPNS